jgi:hypothetical protein
VPAAQPLSVDRRVRAWLADDQIVQGRLLAQDPAGATLRCAGPAGVTFPQVQPWQLEPEAVMPSEAAELGLAALAAAKPRLARLWCACGLSAARDRVPSRLLELRALLPD